ncbi:ATP-dependent Clp protease ATP-binding subunit [Pseudenhygromyxa sp. WMMC2535]|uniref:AAA family ATPase n=1 Tax=Pseudenhygromyxa sp. WMMC2535 TaxID=2712867 RepID=UPI0015517DA3|nr:AAA family ATPase [Pseudenhygromyxa sp. WMMC2535]NVB39830.1 ATP-dependent Clp protease ATP-binding subunit [Pseudenhygromyxa sp. WMMC2535]
MSLAEPLSAVWEATREGNATLICHGCGGPFYAGLDRAPAKTLLEVVLQAALLGAHEDVLVFSEIDSSLPRLRLSADFTVGQRAGAWLLRGEPEESEAAPEPPPETNNPISLFGLVEVSTHQHDRGRLLWPRSHQTWLQTMDRVCAEIEQRCGVRWLNGQHEADGRARRSLVLIQDHFLALRQRDVSAVRADFNAATSLPFRFRELPRLSQDCDLIIWCQDAETATALAEGTFLQRQVGRFGQQDAPRGHEAFAWSNARVVEFPALERADAWQPYLRRADASKSFYDALRTTPVEVTRAHGPVADPWEPDRLAGLLPTAASVLRERVIGQERAINALVSLLSLSASGLEHAHKGERGRQGPRAVFVFAGPTGVGKTELAKAIAELLFGTEQALVRFDMGGMKNEHDVARLIGSPPGYVGSTEGGPLPRAVLAQPNSVVLFDEFEKAHPSVYDTLLPIIGDGTYTDEALGQTVSFKNCVFIFTSNIGVTQVNPKMERASVKRRIKQAVIEHFNSINRLELLGRIGKARIMVFDYVSGSLARILFDKMFDALIERLHETRGAELAVPPEFRDALAAYCMADVGQGVRGIEDRFRESVAEALSMKLLELGRIRGRRLAVSEWRIDGGGSEIVIEDED